VLVLPRRDSSQVVIGIRTRRVDVALPGISASAALHAALCHDLDGIARSEGDVGIFRGMCQYVRVGNDADIVSVAIRDANDLICESRPGKKRRTQQYDPQDGKT